MDVVHKQARLSNPAERKINKFEKKSFHSYLFLDGRFTNGAARICPDESEVRKKIALWPFSPLKDLNLSI